MVRAHRRRRDARALAPVARLRRLDRATGRAVDVRRPVDRGERLGRDELTGEPVDDVEEAVLGRLQQHLARPAGDGQVGQDHLLRGVEVPVVAGGDLVMPDVVAGAGPQGDDRRQVQVIAVALATVVAAPRRAVAGADEHQVGLEVVGQPVPRRAAAAVLPPLAAPGAEGELHRAILERLGRVARDHVPAPHLLAGARVVGGEIAADAVLAAAVADEHQPFHDARRAGDAVVAADRRRLDRPLHLAGPGVEGHQPSVEQADVDAPAVECHPAVDRPATEPRAALGHRAAHERRVPFPLERAGPRVDGEHDAPRRGPVQRAIPHQGRRLDLALRADLGRPGQPEPADVAGVDLGQRAVPCLGVVAAVRDPLAGGRRQQRGVIDGPVLAGESDGGCRTAGEGEPGRRSERDAHATASCERRRPPGRRPTAESTAGPGRVDGPACRPAGASPGRRGAAARGRR